jgi:hypothetical protein
MKFAASADRRFKFRKRRQLFIRVHDETLSVAPMRVNDPNCLSVGIQRLTAIAQVHACFSSQSFWKRGSERNESQISQGITC